jgi:hypothetical protein
MRARLIKPQFFRDVKLLALAPLTRMLFAGLWTLADREGRLEDDPLQIRMEVLPLDPCDPDALLGELAAGGFIQRYQVGSRHYIQVTNFLKHQQPHYKEPASTIPAPPGHQDSQVVTFGVSNEQRARILARDRSTCLRCGATDNLTIDHIHPRSRGGSGDDDNLQTLCRRCNSTKNNKLAASIVGSTSAQRRANEIAPWTPVTVPVPVPEAEAVEEARTSVRAAAAPPPRTRPDLRKPKDKEKGQVQQHPLFPVVDEFFGPIIPSRWSAIAKNLNDLDALGATPDDLRYRATAYPAVMGIDPNGKPFARTLPALINNWQRCAPPGVNGRARAPAEPPPRSKAETAELRRRILAGEEIE